MHVPSVNLNIGTANVGTSNFAAGYSKLPNGLLLLWGTATTNTLGTNTVTFSTATGTSFTNVFSVSLTPGAAMVNGNFAVTTANTTTIIISSGNTTATTVYWNAIGK